MNRREWLAAIALASCGPRTRPASKPRRRDADAREEGAPIVDDWGNGRTTQLGRSPLLVRGDLIVRRTPDELEFLDAATLTRRDRVTESYLSTCLAPNGAMLALAHRDDAPCEMDVFEGTTLARSMPVPECPMTGGLAIVATSASAVYVAGTNAFTHYRLDDGALVADGVTEVGGDEEQAIALDGRLLVPSGRKLHALGSSRATLEAAGRVAHVCPGSRGRLWYSTWNEHDEVDRVLLVRARATLSTQATLAFAPDRVTHMAAGADGSLAIVVAHAGPPTFWQIVLVDENGAEKRRITIDDDVMQRVGADLNAAFVALAPSTVMLDAGRHGTVGWNLTSGARL